MNFINDKPIDELQNSNESDFSISRNNNVANPISMSTDLYKQSPFILLDKLLIILKSINLTPEHKPEDFYEMAKNALQAEGYPPDLLNPIIHALIGVSLNAERSNQIKTLTSNLERLLHLIKDVNKNIPPWINKRCPNFGEYRIVIAI